MYSGEQETCFPQMMVVNLQKIPKLSFQGVMSDVTDKYFNRREPQLAEIEVNV